MLLVVVSALAWAPRAGALTFNAASGSPFPVDVNPMSIVLGDFNGDGNLDFATANFSAQNLYPFPGSVSVLLGNGGGGFGGAAGSPFTVEQGPDAVVTADFNGDGKLDLATANSGPENVSALLGNGSGSFTNAAGSPFTVGGGAIPRSVAVGDFDGDGKLDLATANHCTACTGSVSVLLGDGGGGFAKTSGSPVGVGGEPHAVAAGDFNRDGNLDLAVTNPVYAAGDHNTVSVLLGDGSGGFAVATGSPFAVGRQPLSIVLGDFNGDGKLDLATANADDNSVSVHLGDGSGGFTAASGSPFGVGSGPVSVAAGDFNGDGKLDLATANSSGSVSVLVGDGGGGFTAASGSPFGVGSGPVSVAAGDFNGDGKLDLATANSSSSGSVSVLLNSPPGVSITGGPSGAISQSDTSFTFGAADATFECRLDAVTWSACASPKSYNGLADGSHTFDVRAAGWTNAPVASRTFTVDTNPPAAFALDSPSDGAANLVSQPTFGWDSTTDATTSVDHYELWIDGAKDHDVANSACSGGHCSTSSQATLSDDSHTWKVKAVDAVGNVRESSTRSFTVDSTPPDAFNLTGPADGATVNARPELDWQASSDAGSGLDHYEVILDGAQLGSNVAPATTSLTPTSDLSAGSHSWKVKALDGVGNVRESSTRSFVVISAPQARISVSPTLALTGGDVHFDASASTPPAAGSITDYEWDLNGDGSFERDTGSSPTTTTSYGDPTTLSPAVKVTSGFGTTDTAATSLEVRRAPPPGELGVTIDHGAQYTNDPDVTVSAVWPPYATTMLVSNDGGFLHPGTFSVHQDTPWTLDSSGPERLPKTIYVRFRGGQSGPETYQDDIILDQTPPHVTDAEIAGGGSSARAAVDAKSARTYHLRVKAKDNASGVHRMQITSHKRHPGRWRRFDRTPRFRTSSHRIFVRVRDGARNSSGWRRAR